MKERKVCVCLTFWVWKVCKRWLFDIKITPFLMFVCLLWEGKGDTFNFIYVTITKEWSKVFERVDLRIWLLSVVESAFFVVFVNPKTRTMTKSCVTPLDTRNPQLDIDKINVQACKQVQLILCSIFHLFSLQYTSTPSESSHTPTVNWWSDTHKHFFVDKKTYNFTVDNEKFYNIKWISATV